MRRQIIIWIYEIKLLQEKNQWKCVVIINHKAAEKWLSCFDKIKDISHHQKLSFF